MEQPKLRARRHLPPSAAGRGRRALRGPACLSGGEGGAAARSPGAGSRRGAWQRGCSSAAARRAGRPSAQLAGLRPLAVSASFAHTPPGPPEPQAFPALLLLLFTLVLRPGSSCLPPALFPPGLVLLLRLSFHTRTHARPLGRPFLSALFPLVLANAVVEGGLMSLRHHAAAAEEGESAAGGLESFGRMCPRIAAGATAVPPPPFCHWP